MQIIINGETREIADGETLSTLIASMKIDPAVLVTELNGEIVPKSDYDQRGLAPGDHLELVRLVGGG